MNCCTNCFLDIELIGFINSNSNNNSSCNFCSTTNTKVVNVKELQDFFIPLLNTYSINENGLDLVTTLQNDWSIFRIPNQNQIKSLLTALTSEFEYDYSELINSNVSIKISSETQELIDNWESFKKEIKEENRFIIKNSADLESIEEVFPPRDYNKGKIFYRSRISNDEMGYNPSDMGKPPHKIAKSGRANPKGIPYLYVAQTIDTTLYEARATFLDYVTIGEFKLLENIKIITLRTSYQVSPFLDGFSIKKYIKHKTFIDILEYELSTPLRRQDNELDYLPTQYLCEYIKHLGYDGVEYGSSLHEGGINLVIFNDNKLECTRTKVYEISKIDIQSKEV